MKKRDLSISKYSKLNPKDRWIWDEIIVMSSFDGTNWIVRIEILCKIETLDLPQRQHLNSFSFQKLHIWIYGVRLCFQFTFFKVYSVSVYVAGNCGNYAFPEMPSHFWKWLEFPQLTRHLQKRNKWFFFWSIKFWEKAKPIENTT